MIHLCCISGSQDERRRVKFFLNIGFSDIDTIPTDSKKRWVLRKNHHHQQKQTKIVNKLHDFSNPRLPFLPKGSDSSFLLPYGAPLTSKKKSLSEAKLRMCWYLPLGKGGVQRLQTRRAMEVAGCPSKPHVRAASGKGLVTPLLPEPAPRFLPFSLSSGHQGRLTPKSSPLPPGSMETPSSSPRWRQPPRGKGPGVRRSGPPKGPERRRWRPGAPTRGSSRHPPPGHSD